MAPPRTVEVTPHTFIGVSLALLGVVLTLDNLGFVEAGAVLPRSGRSSRSWSAPLYVVQGRETRDWMLGTGWMAGRHGVPAAQPGASSASACGTSCR